MKSCGDAQRFTWAWPCQGPQCLKHSQVAKPSSAKAQGDSKALLWIWVWMVTAQTKCPPQLLPPGCFLPKDSSPPETAPTEIRWLCARMDAHQQPGKTQCVYYLLLDVNHQSRLIFLKLSAVSLSEQQVSVGEQSRVAVLRVEEAVVASYRDHWFQLKVSGCSKSIRGPGGGSTIPRI